MGRKSWWRESLNHWYFFCVFFYCDLAQKPLTTPGSCLSHSSGKHLFLVEIHRICPILGTTDSQQNFCLTTTPINSILAPLWRRTNPNRRFWFQERRKSNWAVVAKTWSVYVIYYFSYYQDHIWMNIWGTAAMHQTQWIRRYDYWKLCRKKILISTRAISEISQSVGISNVISRLVTICYRRISDTFAHLILKNSIFHINLLILNVSDRRRTNQSQLSSMKSFWFLSYNGSGASG